MISFVDLAVAGGGPAGLAGAIHAAQAGLNVVVLEPRRGLLDKACGEGIMPGGVEALEDLGIRPHGVPFIGVEYADASDPSSRATGFFPSGAIGLGVRRTALHAAMRRRAQLLGVRFCDARVTSFEQRPDGVLVNGELHARWLVGADGLRSDIRRMLGVERPARAPARLGVRRHYAVRPWSDCVQVYFGEHSEAYVTPVDTKLVGVAFLFEQRRNADVGRHRFDELLAGFPILARQLEDKPVASRLRGSGPFEQRVERRVVGNVLLVGDAGGYVDPLTGEGVALGLATARAAVRSILEGDPSVYEARYRHLTRRYFALTSALLAVARRRRLHKVLLRLARAWPAVFDATLGILSHTPDEDAGTASTRPNDDVTIGLDRLL